MADQRTSDECVDPELWCPDCAHPRDACACDIKLLPPEPDAYCVTTPDGGCASEDPRCMHNRTSNPVVVPADRLEQYWRDIYPDGMTIEQVNNELHDLEFLAGAVPHVYCHVTGGMISKPNTLPEVVCSVHDDHVTKLVEEAIEEDRELRAADETATAPSNPVAPDDVLDRLRLWSAWTHDHTDTRVLLGDAYAEILRLRALVPTDETAAAPVVKWVRHEDLHDETADCHEPNHYGEPCVRVTVVATAGCICRSVPTLQANPDCPVHGDGDTDAL